MIAITFLGAARTVTGSKYLVEANGTRVMVDAGLFQGMKELRERNWQELPVPASSLEAIVLTHAHLDHCGYLPRLVSQGFRGRVFCTQGTQDLCRIVLPDAGLGAARRCGQHDYVRLRDLRQQFSDGEGVCGGAERRRGAERNDNRASSLAAELSCNPLHGWRALLARTHIAHVSTEQTIEQGVRRDPVRRGAVRDEHAPEPEPGGDRGRRAGVVGLNAAGGDEGVGPFRDRLRRNQLQLANRVAAEAERNRIVALHQEPKRQGAGRDEGFLQPRHGVERRGLEREREARQRGKPLQRGAIGRH